VERGSKQNPLPASAAPMVSARRHFSGKRRCRDYHNPSFKRMAARDCGAHGFDLKTF